MAEPVSDGFHLACVADWDATSYTTKVPHCLRRVNLNLTTDDRTGEVHHDGQIWSRALWDMNQTLGRTETDTIVLEGQFSFTPDTSFKAAAEVIVATARALYGHAAQDVAQQAFEDRGIL
jgi:Zn-dependent metalloprotease